MRDPGIVTNLFHYPIKGLSAQPLRHVELSAGRGFPFDRIVALARADGGYDEHEPGPWSKDCFFMLVREPRLAGLQTHFAPESSRLTISVQGRCVHESDLSIATGREATAEFFRVMLDLSPDKRPVVAHERPRRFTDAAPESDRMMNAISLINVASVADLARRAHVAVDPLRFRGNLYFEGWPPFSELESIGHEIRVGCATLRILARTERCAATEVNVVSARRDLPIPRMLIQHYGHADMGVYAEVISGGRIEPGGAVVRDASRPSFP